MLWVRTCSRSYCAPVIQGRAVLGMLTYFIYAPLPALRPSLSDGRSCQIVNRFLDTTAPHAQQMNLTRFAAQNLKDEIVNMHRFAAAWHAPKAMRNKAAYRLNRIRPQSRLQFVQARLLSSLNPQRRHIHPQRSPYGFDARGSPAITHLNVWLQE